MIAFGWLLIGALTSASHILAPVATFIGDAGVITALVSAPFLASALAVGYLEREQQRDTARDGTGLSPEAEKILAAIERGEMHEGLYDENGSGQ